MIAHPTTMGCRRHGLLSRLQLYIIYCTLPHSCTMSMTYVYTIYTSLHAPKVHTFTANGFAVYTEDPVIMSLIHVETPYIKRHKIYVHISMYNNITTYMYVCITGVSVCTLLERERERERERGREGEGGRERKGEKASQNSTLTTLTCPRNRVSITYSYTQGHTNTTDVTRHIYVCKCSLAWSLML